MKRKDTFDLLLFSSEDSPNDSEAPYSCLLFPFSFQYPISRWTTRPALLHYELPHCSVLRQGHAIDAKPNGHVRHQTNFGSRPSYIWARANSIHPRAQRLFPYAISVNSKIPKRKKESVKRNKPFWFCDAASIASRSRSSCTQNSKGIKPIVRKHESGNAHPLFKREKLNARTEQV